MSVLRLLQDNNANMDFKSAGDSSAGSPSWTAPTASFIPDGNTLVKKLLPRGCGRCHENRAAPTAGGYPNQLNRRVDPSCIIGWSSALAEYIFTATIHAQVDELLHRRADRPNDAVVDAEYVPKFAALEEVAEDPAMVLSAQDTLVSLGRSLFDVLRNRGVSENVRLCFTFMPRRG